MNDFDRIQDSVDILKKLISFKSVSKHVEGGDNWPEEWRRDYEALPLWIRDFLEFHGINTRIIEANGVKNVVAKVSFGSGRNLVFNGHWDIVPPGSGWVTDPFKAVEKDGKIFGRGACDMKGALAVMLKVMVELAKREWDFGGEVYLFAVGDEELGGYRGTKYVLDKLIDGEGLRIDAALVGEPTSLNIRIGRRGVIRIKIRVFGKVLRDEQGIHIAQCHSARSDECENAIYNLVDIINRLRSIRIREKVEEPFPPTAFNVTMINCGVAPNVIPGECEVVVDVRNTPSVTKETLLKDIKDTLSLINEEKYLIEDIKELAKPFKTNPNHEIILLLKDIIRKIAKIEPQLNALGGTSDARFFAYRGIPVAEVGVDDKTLHHANEWTSIETMKKLEKVYLDFVKKFLEK